MGKFKLSKDKADMVYKKFGKMIELTGCGKPGEKLALNIAIKLGHVSLPTLASTRQSMETNTP
jgi:hypothetical protein